MNKRLELREKSLKQQPEADKGHDRSLKEASVASEFTAGSKRSKRSKILLGVLVAWVAPDRLLW